MAELLDDVLVSLRRILRATSMHSRKLGRSVGLSAPQLLVLRTCRDEEWPTASEIARAVSLSQATITTIRQPSGEERAAAARTRYHRPPPRTCVTDRRRPGSTGRGAEAPSGKFCGAFRSPASLGAAPTGSGTGTRRCHDGRRRSRCGAASQRGRAPSLTRTVLDRIDS